MEILTGFFVYSMQDSYYFDDFVFYICSFILLEILNYTQVGLIIMCLQDLTMRGIFRLVWGFEKY